MIYMYICIYIYIISIPKYLGVYVYGVQIQYNRYTNICILFTRIHVHMCSLQNKCR